MAGELPYRRRWMLAGFAVAFLIGDMFLAVRGASSRSVEFLYGVAGFSLAQMFWTIGQLREARPDWRVFLAAGVPLAAFVLVRLRPPVLSPAAETAVFIYSLLTAVSFATALATRRVFYMCGIGLLLLSDMMIGMRFVKMPGCGELVGPVYILAEICLLASFFMNGEKRVVYGRWNVWHEALAGGLAAFAIFTVAAFCFPGGGYNPFRRMLSVLGRTVIQKESYPLCHYLFIAGMFFAAASVAAVWARLAHLAKGWRRHAIGWGGALNVAGLGVIALVPENVNIFVHNAGCHIAAIGGAAVLAARFRKGADFAWTCYLVALLAFFCVCLTVDALTFDPWVTSTQKVLIVSFAIWTAHLAWRERNSS